MGQELVPPHLSAVHGPAHPSLLIGHSLLPGAAGMAQGLRFLYIGGRGAGGVGR